MPEETVPTAAAPAPSTAVPPRPTAGPAILANALVPTSLLEELGALEGKFKQRELELASQREQLERERERFQRAVAAREWELQKEQHSLDVQKENWAASSAEAETLTQWQYESSI